MKINSIYRLNTQLSREIPEKIYKHFDGYFDIYVMIDDMLRKFDHEY